MHRVLLHGPMSRLRQGPAGAVSALLPSDPHERPPSVSLLPASAPVSGPASVSVLCPPPPDPRRAAMSALCAPSPPPRRVPLPVLLLSLSAPGLRRQPRSLHQNCPVSTPRLHRTALTTDPSEPSPSPPAPPPPPPPGYHYPGWLLSADGDPYQPGGVLYPR